MSEKPSLSIKDRRNLSRPDIAFCLASVPGTDAFFYGSSDASVYHVDLSQEKPEPIALTGDHLHSSYVTGLAGTESGFLVSGSYDRQLIWWDEKSRKSIRSIGNAHEKWIRQVKASPDGKIIASVGDDMVCRLWDSSSGSPLAGLRGHEPETPHHYPSMLFTCEFNHDGSQLATADKVGHIVIWDVATRKPLRTLEAPTMYTWDPDRRRHSIGGVRSLAFSPDGKLLAAGGMGQVGNIDHLGGKARVRLFDLVKGDTLAEIEASEINGLVEKLAFHPRRDWLLACGGDHKGFSLLIDPNTGKTILEEKSPNFHVHDFALIEGGSAVLSGGHNQLSVQDIG